MAKQIRSARGEVVDFDILSIKAQIASGQAVRTEEASGVDQEIKVKRQENFIDRRLKRQVAKATVDKTALVDVQVPTTSNEVNT